MAIEEGFVLTKNWDRMPFFSNFLYKSKYNKIKSHLDNLNQTSSRGDALQYLNFNPQESKEKLEEKINHRLLNEMQLTGSINSGYKLTESGRKSYDNIYSGRMTLGDLVTNFVFGKILRVN